MVQTSWLNFWAQAAILLPAFLISVSFHEFSHALTAYLLGDSTAKDQGRLTINPLAHLDFFGLLFLLLFRIGWANPVPMDYRNFKYPRLFAIITALAGPFSNFLLATVTFVCIKYFPSTLFSPAVGMSLIQILTATAYVNIMLGVFNILPIPPLDGSHIIIALLSKRFPKFVIWLYRYSLVFLILLFFIPQIRELLSTLIIATEQFIKGIVF
jgi:Zn-dependent protease